MRVIVTVKAPQAFSQELDDPGLKDVSDYVHKGLKKWVEYDEYIRIEFDLEAGTAKVLEVER